MVKTFWVTIVAVLAAAVVTVSCISQPLDGGAKLRKPSADEGRKYPPEEFSDGFAVLDVLKDTPYGQDGEVLKPFMSDEDLAQVKTLKLEAYEPIYDFNAQDTKGKKLDKVEPWIAAGLDLTKAADAERLAKILQAYVYEGFFDRDNSKNTDKYDKHFRQNKKRTWCQTPWLNVTEKGREAIHGMTKEFPISTTSVYTVPEDIEKGEKAVTWGIGFFNKKICDGYDHFFHPSKFGEGGTDYEDGLVEKINNHTLDFKAADGAVTFKLLFSAMENWQDNMRGQWDGAYNWYAHVSPHRQNDKAGDGDESQRLLMNIPHVQMDIGFKDSRVKGTNPALKNWVMMTYYFDPQYDGNELLKDVKMPAALRHMRPVGLQYGLEAGQTHIFDGSRNNHRPKGEELAYDQTRLNGPVDNKQSSCLGCHAGSGINFGLAGGKRAPGLGFMTQADYDKWYKAAGNKSFDFDMQIDKAMRNFSNSKQDKIKEHFDENLK